MKQNDKKEKFKLRIYRYVLRLIRFLTKLPNDPVLREIKGQLTRSGTSVGTNYFEADAASSKRDFQNFFSHALKSANESKFWLIILINSGLIPKNLISEAKWLLQETKELADIFASSIITMKGRRSL
jgi:four helix bundle protein